MPGSLASSPRIRRPISIWNLASAWIPVAICIFVIAGESTVYFGADHTTEPLQRFFEFLLQRHFTEPQWWRLHLFIRKCGHFTGYGILSLSWFRAFWMTWPILPDRNGFRLQCHGLAMLGTLLVASSDEFHQLFLPNRTGSIWDVMIDCTGGLLMQIVVWVWMRGRFRN